MPSSIHFELSEAITDRRSLAKELNIEPLASENFDRCFFIYICFYIIVLCCFGIIMLWSVIISFLAGPTITAIANFISVSGVATGIFATVRQRISKKNSSDEGNRKNEETPC